MTLLTTALRTTSRSATLLLALLLVGCTQPVATPQRDEQTQLPQQEGTVSILAWNVESAGNDPDVITEQLAELTGYDIYCLAEVYAEVRSRRADFLYLDPPYETGRTRLYAGRFDFHRFFGCLGQQRGGYALSLNGYVDGEDRTVPVPDDLYDEHLQLAAGPSARRLTAGGEPQVVTDSLYVRMQHLVPCSAAHRVQHSAWYTATNGGLTGSPLQPYPIPLRT